MGATIIDIGGTDAPLNRSAYTDLPTGKADGTWGEVDGYSYRYSTTTACWIPAHWYGILSGFVQDASANNCDLNPDSTVAGLEAAGWTKTDTPTDSASGIVFNFDNSVTDKLDFVPTAMPSKVGVVLQTDLTAGVASSPDGGSVFIRDGSKVVRVWHYIDDTLNKLGFAGSGVEIAAVGGNITLGSGGETWFLELNLAAGGACYLWSSADPSLRMSVSYDDLIATATTDVILNTDTSGSPSFTVDRCQVLDLTG